MLAYSPTVDASPTSGGHVSERFRPPPAIERGISQIEPSADSLQTITLRQKFLGLGPSRNALRFLRAPTLHHDIINQRVEVQGWGLFVPNSNNGLASVTREMARKFLRLWQDAEHNRLAEEDRKAWFHIVANVDIDAFHRSLERPRYLEGQLAGSPQRWFIRWPGEEGSTKIPEKFSSQFSLYNREEWVGAHFLLDHDNKIVGVERVVPIPAPNYDELENWPPVAL